MDRAIIGDFLGRLCVEATATVVAFASALVTAKGTSEPSEGFWSLLDKLEVFRSTDANRRLMFWSGEVAKAREWYGGAAPVAMAI